MSELERTLLRRLRDRDERAFRELIENHRDRVFNITYRMLGNRAEAEDVAQEVFLRVWREAPRWKPGAAKFETWMHRVALNLCYDRLRRRRERTDPDAGADVADTAPLASEVWLARQRSSRVHAALAQLPERQRAAIALVHFQEETNIAAAAALEVSVDALESLLARGRRALKAALADVAQDLMGEAAGAPRL